MKDPVSRIFNQSFPISGSKSENLIDSGTMIERSLVLGMFSVFEVAQRY